MKKLIALIFLACVSMASLAAQEMDINYYYLKSETLNITDANDDSADIDRSAVPVGLELNIDIPFNESAFQIGMNINIGMDFGSTYEMAAWEEQEDFFTASYFFSLGLLLRLNLGKHNSFSFRPGFQYTQVLGNGSFYFRGYDTDVDIKTDAKFLAFSLNLAYAFWFSNTVGLNVGLDWDKPFVGLYTITNRDDSTDTYSFDIKGDSSLRFFVGIAIYFGNRNFAHSSSNLFALSSSAKTNATTSDTAEETTDGAAASSGGITKAGTKLDFVKLRQGQRSRLYNAKINGAIAGPYTITTLAQMAKQGIVTQSTPVLPSGASGWVEAGAVSDLAVLFK